MFKTTQSNINTKTITTFLFSVFICLNIDAQTITGNIVDNNNIPLIGCDILDITTLTGNVSDSNGKFTLDVKNKSVLEFSYLGYKKITLDISTIDLTKPITIVMESDSELLGEVVVTAKSEATKTREQAYAVEVIGSKGFKNISTNANTILSRVSGVNIRESGGLGSDFSLSLNGLSGSQVRIFLNGVPMDYFGSSLSLNNFAANLIDRIEVYKGVVPVHLSSDALGGAINVVMNSTAKNYLDASYSFGSFNTHIASVNAQYRLSKSGFTQRIKTFYNFSDNNYKVPVQLIDFNTGKKSDEETWHKRFHDGYESKMAWYEAGFTNTSWADEAMIGVLYSDNYKELQQPVNAIGQAGVPYGEVATGEEKIIANASFRKKGLLKNKLAIAGYAVGVFSETYARDTSSVRYDWYGNYTQKTDNQTGEVENRKTFLKITNTNFLTNVNTEYAFTDRQSATFNYSLNDLEIVGSDDYKAQNNTQFSKPSTVLKQVSAVSYTQSFFDKTLKGTLFGKYYSYKLNSLETNYQGTEVSPFENKKNELGYGFTTTYLKNGLQVKASFERSIRYPEVVELFGDGLNIIANPSLNPESSLNYNVGFQWNKLLESDKLLLSVNGYVRDAKDFIIPVLRGLKAVHQNLGSVLSKGVDLNVGYTFNNKIILSLNSSYLDLRNNNKYRIGTTDVENALYRARVPNVPYFYNNLNISYRNKGLFSDTDGYSVSINQNHVHEFYYRWEKLGNRNKGIIDTQFSTNLDFVYNLQNERYNISFSIVNLFDRRLYDNFQQLRPGRNFNFKFRYFIN